MDAREPRCAPLISHPLFMPLLLSLLFFQTGETRFIKHLLYLKWPDYGVPPSAKGFLNFVIEARKLQENAVKDMPEWKVGLQTDYIKPTRIAWAEAESTI